MKPISRREPSRTPSHSIKPKQPGQHQHALVNDQIQIPYQGNSDMHSIMFGNKAFQT